MIIIVKSTSAGCAKLGARTVYKNRVLGIKF